MQASWGAENGAPRPARGAELYFGRSVERLSTPFQPNEPRRLTETEAERALRSGWYMERWSNRTERERDGAREREL